tara:strand:- start:3437 stop:4270 length:834 start_codon:yes stop_codon:yes gene_type:complete
MTNLFRLLAIVVVLFAPRMAQSEDVLLKEGDIVNVTVFGEPSISGVFTVGPNGTVALPLLGSVEAIGRSAADLGGEIEARLESSYIRDAQVVVALAKESELPPQTVTVIGQVTAPGRVPFEAGTSIDLFTAVSSAGGIAQFGNRHRIELKRREGEDLRTSILSIDNDRVYKLRDGDTLIVHALEEVVVKIETITVIGQVNNPGAIEMDPENPYDVITGIAIAGGFTRIARPSKVVVRRRTADGVQTFELDINKMQKSQSAPFMLQPNDTVAVPESIF